ncbi:MAG: hypothetical protein J0L55_05510 [Caulobacterales bacterium]|nr:hypothetical protein [Caulobacterales bacterium]MCA0372605.1 DUF6326 family protein [Pseudomonadota bacterium]
MNTGKTQQNLLEDLRVNMKLAALWASFMFLYIYVDYFHLYMPGSLQDMLAGKVFTFDVSQTFLVISLISVSIPAIMISLSVILPANANRLTNIIIAAIYIPYSLFNLAGLAWIHMYIGAAIEVALLLLIINFALKWPRINS